MSSSHPNRSSSHLRTARRGAISLCLAIAPDENFVAAHLGFEQFQRSRRRPGNILAGQVILAVVAGAPDALQIVTVLDGAGKMRACRRHGAEFSARHPHQQSRTSPKTKNLSTIGLELS